MGINTDVVALLQDLVQFLETLSDVNLPIGLQSVRENLLRRSKTSLIAVGQRSTTPEPYLDMNAGKGKGLHMIESMNVNNVNDGDSITEYMYADNSNQSKLSSCQDYYEPCLANVVTNINENTNKPKCNDGDDELVTIYRTFSSEQTISKATKCGPLFLKEERRLFGFQIFSGFDQYRSCFVGLVGTHLLMYATKHDKHPSDVISIRDYSARASPNAIPRDLERSKSAFEMFSPGNRTFQFTARSPKEMEQWVAVICRSGNAIATTVKQELSVINPITSETAKKRTLSLVSTCSEEQYQDVGFINNENNLVNVQTSDSNGNNDNKIEVILRNEQKFTTFTSTDRFVIPPPLPARIPRRLPSLPHEHQSTNIDSIYDCYDEDDIYHKIEDLKQPTSTYQNLTPAQHDSHINDNCKGSKRNEKKTISKIKNNKKISSTSVEIYDDAHPAENLNANEIKDERMSITYDDIQTNNVNNVKKEIVKETKKKSFLDRVRYKKESPQKEESKKKLKQNKLNSNKEIIQLQCETSQELPPYDDVIGLGIEVKENNTEDMGNYTCPPPPRAIYGKPLSINATVDQSETDFYDDIGVYQNNRDENILNKSRQVSITVESSCSMNDENLSRFAMTTATTTTNCQDESEHYQVPRTQDPIDITGQVEVKAPMVEELYDDIAIVANFRTRQRNSSCSNSSLPDKIHNSSTNVLKVWNRFASGRKLKTNDIPTIEKNKLFYSNEGVDASSFDSNDEVDSLKMNKFQKLINKMESSLNKSKPIPAMINKSHDDNIN